MRYEFEMGRKEKQEEQEEEEQEVPIFIMNDRKKGFSTIEFENPSV